MNKCWICGDHANSREHIIKRTNLEKIFDNKPIYKNDLKSKNLKAQSLKSDYLKFPKSICSVCNGNVTQPFDRSWDIIFNYLFDNKKIIIPNSKIKLNKIFKYDTKRHMLNVHLYCLKILGCVLNDIFNTVLPNMGEHLQRRKAFKNFYLCFGTKDQNINTKEIHWSDVHLIRKDVIFFSIYYEHTTISFFYSFSDIDYPAKKIGWSSLKSAKNIVISDTNQLSTISLD